MDTANRRRKTSAHLSSAPRDRFPLAAFLATSVLILLLVGLQNSVFSANKLGAAPLVEPSARYGHSLVTIRDSVYLFGGTSGTSSTPIGREPSAPREAPMNDLWLFNEHQWEELTPSNPPPARTNHAAAMVNGQMYVYGGKNASGMLLEDLWVFNPTANTWTQVTQNGAEKPGLRSEHGMVEAGNTLILFGGTNSSTGDWASPYAWQFDTTTQTWIKKAYCSVCMPRRSFALGNLDGQVLAWGGYPPTTKAHVYSPASNTWTEYTVTNAPSPYQDMAAVVYNHRLVTFGGRHYVSSNPELGEVLNEAWGLALSGGFPGIEAYWAMLEARFYAAAALLPPGTQLPSATPQQVLIFGGKNASGQVIAQTEIYTFGSSSLYLPLLLRAN